MSFMIIDNTFPGGYGSKINGFPVPVDDRRGAYIRDFLNLSTQFVRGDYAEFGHNLRSPMKWRGSHRKEGTYAGIRDFLTDPRMTSRESGIPYITDSQIAPVTMTEGKGGTIDFTLQCSVISSDAINAFEATLSSQYTKPTLNHGDWDSWMHEQPTELGVDGAVAFSIVGGSDIGKRYGRFYVAAMRRGDAEPNHRPFFVLKDAKEWEPKFVGLIEGSEEDTLEFSKDVTVHELMRFTPDMFVIDFEKTNKRPTVDEPYTRVSLPPSAIRVTRDGDGNINLGFSSHSDATAADLKVDLTKATRLTKEDEPLRDISVEFCGVPPALLNTPAAWKPDIIDMFMRIVGRTKSGYTFLVDPKIAVAKVTDLVIRPDISGKFSRAKFLLTVGGVSQTVETYMRGVSPLVPPDDPHGGGGGDKAAFNPSPSAIPKVGKTTVSLKTEPKPIRVLPTMVAFMKNHKPTLEYKTKDDITVSLDDGLKCIFLTANEFAVTKMIDGSLKVVLASDSNVTTIIPVGK